MYYKNTIKKIEPYIDDFKYFIIKRPYKKIYITIGIFIAALILSNLILTIYMYNQGFNEINFIIIFSNIIYFFNHYTIYILFLLLLMYLDRRYVQKL